MKDDSTYAKPSRRNLLAGGASFAMALPVIMAAAGTQPVQAQEALQSISSPETQPPFDPKNYPIVPPKRFEDLKVGDVFRAPGGP